MLIIPEGVSQHLVEELEQFQNQIHILLRNHQVRNAIFMYRKRRDSLRNVNVIAYC